MAESVGRLTGEQLKAAEAGGKSVEDALPEIVKESWLANKRVIFNGDNYSEEWHKEAEQRGLGEPADDARRPARAHQRADGGRCSGRFGVLSKRELEARFEVMAEQYATKVNIEAETAATIARTQLLPAAVRHLACAARCRRAASARSALAGETGEMIEELWHSDPDARGARTTRPRGSRASSGRGTSATR